MNTTAGGQTNPTERDGGEHFGQTNPSGFSPGRDLGGGDATRGHESPAEPDSALLFARGGSRRLLGDGKIKFARRVGVLAIGPHGLEAALAELDDDQRRLAVLAAVVCKVDGGARSRLLVGKRSVQVLRPHRPFAALADHEELNGRHAAGTSVEGASGRPQLAALRLTPFRSATVESFLSAAFFSLRFVVRSRTTSSCPSSSAHAIKVP